MAERPDDDSAHEPRPASHEELLVAAVRQAAEAQARREAHELETRERLTWIFEAAGRPISEPSRFTVACVFHHLGFVGSIEVGTEPALRPFAGEICREFYDDVDALRTRLDDPDSVDDAPVRMILLSITFDRIREVIDMVARPGGRADRRLPRGPMRREPVFVVLVMDSVTPSAIALGLELRDRYGSENDGVVVADVERIGNLPRLLVDIANTKVSEVLDRKRSMFVNPPHAQLYTDGMPPRRTLTAIVVGVNTTKALASLTIISGRAAPKNIARAADLLETIFPTFAYERKIAAGIYGTGPIFGVVQRYALELGEYLLSRLRYNASHGAGRSAKDDQAIVDLLLGVRPSLTRAS